MLNQIRKLLLDIGLSENEAAVLYALLQGGSLKASDVARKAKLNRTTTYGNIKSLLHRGLVSSYKKYGITEYESIDPVLLPSYIERQRELLQTKKQEAEQLLPEILKIRTFTNALPMVTFFEGPEGVKQAYEDTLVKNKEKAIYVFSGPDAVFKELGEEYISYYVNKRLTLGITCHQISPNTSWGKLVQSLDKKSRRFTRLIPAAFSFDTEMVIYDNKLAIFSFTHDKLVAVIIEDSAISNSMKKLFKYVEGTTVKIRH